MNIPEIKHKINTHIQNPGTKLWIILAILVISNIASFELGKSYINNDTDTTYSSNSNNYNENTNEDYSLADPELSNSAKSSTLAGAVALSAQNSTNNREESINTDTTPDGSNLRYVASKNGRVYYFTWCAGAKRILPDNRQYFENASAAKEAGLSPSKSCPGLD